MNKELISRYLQGDVTETEYDEVRTWIEEQGASWMDQFIAEHWDLPIINTTQAEKDSMAESVLAAVRHRKPTDVPVTRKLFIGKRMIRWAAAACLVIIAGSTGWLLWSRQAAHARELTWQTIRNDSSGIIRLVYLPDSSQVILNAHSLLRFANNYNDTTRELELTGEAFFEVRHDEKRPFIVHAGQMATRVYGTAFNISAYPEASQLTVSLKRGRIGVRGSSFPEQVLQPGELLLYNKRTGVTLTDKQSTNDIGNWIGGKLNFHKTPLKDVLYTLEKKYGVKFSYDVSLKDQTITAGFEKAPLQQVLQHLSFIWNIRFEQGKNSIHVQ